MRILSLLTFVLFTGGLSLKTNARQTEDWQHSIPNAAEVGAAKVTATVAPVKAPFPMPAFKSQCLLSTP